MADARRGGAAAPDRALCLSMHQPWASLLVWGIKRIEGRGWPSDHRGRLWIAATVQPPAPEDIEELEAFYRSVHAADAGSSSGIGSAQLEFPPAYPTGVLLGCVEVVDVVAAERVAAWEALPGGLQVEVGSPFCFLCEQAQRLVVPQQMKGAHKIYPLEKKLHKVAQLGLKPAPNSQGLRWAAFGTPPPLPDAALSPQKNGKLQYKQQSGGGGTAADSGSGQPSDATAAAAVQQQQDAQQPLDAARRLRAVQKKLRQIEGIAEKAAAGQALQPEEAAKLAQQQDLEAEAARLAALG